MKLEHKMKYRKLGLKIGYYRRLKGLTQEQLAEKIDKNPAFVGAVEAPNVNRTLSLDTLFDIADTLDVPAYKFFDFNDDWILNKMLSPGFVVPLRNRLIY